MVREEREECPGEGERGDDEEDEDGGGREGVGLGEAVDEPGEHAHYGDLKDSSQYLIFLDKLCGAKDERAQQEGIKHTRSTICEMRFDTKKTAKNMTGGLCARKRLRLGSTQKQGAPVDSDNARDNKVDGSDWNAGRR